jgi:hypothetical protein
MTAGDFTARVLAATAMAILVWIALITGSYLVGICWKAFRAGAGW